MNNPYIVKNLYSGSGSGHGVEDVYIQKGDIFKHPARILIVGPSGSGKTNLLGFIVADHLAWDTLTIFAKNTEQPIFRKFQDIVLSKIEKLNVDPEDYFHVSDEIDKNVKDFDHNLQNVVVFDDMTHRTSGKNKTTEQIDAFMKYGRPQNITVIVVTQNFHDATKRIRENANYAIMFPTKAPEDRRRFSEYYCQDLSKDQRIGLMEKAFRLEITPRMTEEEKEQKKMNAFFFVGPEEWPNHLRYRKGLGPGLISSESQREAKIGGFREPVSDEDSDDEEDTEFQQLRQLLRGSGIGPSNMSFRPSSIEPRTSRSISQSRQKSQWRNPF